MSDFFSGIYRDAVDCIIMREKSRLYRLRDSLWYNQEKVEDGLKCIISLVEIFPDQEEVMNCFFRLWNLIEEQYITQRSWMAVLFQLDQIMKGESVWFPCFPLKSAEEYFRFFQSVCDDAENCWERLWRNMPVSCCRFAWETSNTLEIIHTQFQQAMSNYRSELKEEKAAAQWGRETLAATLFEVSTAGETCGSPEEEYEENVCKRLRDIYLGDKEKWIRERDAEIREEDRNLLHLQSEIFEYFWSIRNTVGNKLSEIREEKKITDLKTVRICQEGSLHKECVKTQEDTIESGFKVQKMSLREAKNIAHQRGTYYFRKENQYYRWDKSADRIFRLCNDGTWEEWDYRFVETGPDLKKITVSELPANVFDMNSAEYIRQKRCEENSTLNREEKEVFTTLIENSLRLKKIKCEMQDAKKTNEKKAEVILDWSAENQNSLTKKNAETTGAMLLSTGEIVGTVERSSKQKQAPRYFILEEFYFRWDVDDDQVFLLCKDGHWAETNSAHFYYDLYIEAGSDLEEITVDSLPAYAQK